MLGSTSKDNLIKSEENLHDEVEDLMPPEEKPLTSIEKTFLLLAERGDCATVRR